MSQSQLAHFAVLPIGVIIEFEAGGRPPRDEDLDAIQDALERAGVEFLDGDRPGVRFRQPVQC
jgi:hypothetical protein